MLKIDIPDFRNLEINHVVMDYNGTLAVNGNLIEAVPQRLIALSKLVDLHVVTADTFGRAKEQLEGLPVTLEILPPGRQATVKAAYVKNLNVKHTITIGNGRNDRLFVETAALGIGVILREGIAVETLEAADLICTSITDALDLLLNPKRLVATLRG